jgi:hypothetical protein
VLAALLTPGRGTMQAAAVPVVLVSYYVIGLPVAAVLAFKTSLGVRLVLTSFRDMVHLSICLFVRFFCLFVYFFDFLFFFLYFSSLYVSAVRHFP